MFISIVLAALLHHLDYLRVILRAGGLFHASKSLQSDVDVFHVLYLFTVRSFSLRRNAGPRRKI